MAPAACPPAPARSAGRARSEVGPDGEAGAGGYELTEVAPDALTLDDQTHCGREPTPQNGRGAGGLLGAASWAQGVPGRGSSAPGSGWHGRPHAAEPGCLRPEAGQGPGVVVLSPDGGDGQEAPAGRWLAAGTPRVPAGALVPRGHDVPSSTRRPPAPGRRAGTVLRGARGSRCRTPNCPEYVTLLNFSIWLSSSEGTRPDAPEEIGTGEGGSVAFLECSQVTDF